VGIERMRERAGFGILVMLLQFGKKAEIELATQGTERLAAPGEPCQPPSRRERLRPSFLD
jgi:hypothetical protein